MSLVVKKQLSGFIKPRWMKPKCVRFWEIGAIPCILGVWMPDFVSQYAHMMSGEPNYAFPPLITYVGALFLWAACAHAVEDMGSHYKMVMVFGWASVILAGASVVLHFMITPGGYTMLALTVLCIGLCAYSATSMFYFTIAKAAELGMETRMLNDQKGVFIINHLAIATGAVTVMAIYMQSSYWPLLLRATVVLFTCAWFLCRLAVYYFKEDKSIGVSFAEPPNDQFWI